MSKNAISKNAKSESENDTYPASHPNVSCVAMPASRSS
jgi:hypothetical protein